MATYQPKYLKLANHLRAQIASGELKPGTQIPSISQLIAQHSMSYISVRDAVLMLKNEGLLEGRAGLGVYVRGSISREERIAELIRTAPPLSTEAIGRLRTLLPAPQQEGSHGN